MLYMTNKNHIKIMAWNANGLLKHKHELELLLNKENIDICLISETHLTSQTFTLFQNYSTYCSNHPLNNARGGSAVIIKKTIKHHEEDKICSSEFQASTICINLLGTDLFVTALYSPPRHNIKVKEYKQLLNRHKGRFVIGGDFNAKHVNWGSRLTTTKGRELWKAVEDLGCRVVSTGKPTYWPTDPDKSPDLIDFFIVRQIPSNTISVEDGLDLNSDHSPIFITISGVIKQNVRNCALSNKCTDWEFFKHKLDTYVNIDTSITNAYDIEKETTDFTMQIQKSAWLSTPELTPKYIPYKYPREILCLLSKKRKLRKKWQTTRFPPLKTELNKLTKLLKDKIQEHKNRAFNTKIQNLSVDKKADYSLWKATANLKKPIIHNPPIKQINNSQVWAKSDIDKAEVFAEHLEKIFQPHERYDSFTPPPAVQESCEIELFTPEEVSSQISKLKTKKSPGFDLITSAVLKNLTYKALIKLTTIINACISLKYIPLLWKISEIIMIPKAGKNANEAASYRPISLLPLMGKLFEKLFVLRLKEIISLKQLIPTHQFGFREKHSTIDQVHRIVHTIEESLEKNNICSAIFLDVAQAFDKVWHEELIYKLKTLLPMQFTELLTSYIEDRYFRVKHGQAYTSLRKINAGVPQGSILGPVLYLLYTSDLPVPKSCKIATFADDTCVLAVGENVDESTAKLQESITVITNWTSLWNIKLNDTKSVHVNFTNKKVIYKPIQIFSANVPYACTAKYLGMTLDTKLRWKEHVKTKVAELNLKYRKLYWLIGRTSKLHIENKLLIYKQILRPVWTYGAQLWGCTAKSNVEIIQRFQNKVIRDIVKAPWYIRNDDLHRDLQLLTVHEMINLCAVKHANRIEQHINAEASSLCDEAIYTRRLKRTKPLDLVVININK